MSFESERAVFVHFPKTGGRAVHYTADQYGHRLRKPPLAHDGHKPASWFAPCDKPSWAVLRDPVEWYVSMYRFCVDAGWSVLPIRAGATFPEFTDKERGMYSRFCEQLEIAQVTHLYHYRDLQRAYNEHVGPEPLLVKGVSVCPAPTVTDEIRSLIESTDRYGYSLYARVR